MQAIIDSLPRSVLSFKDRYGKTIADYDFNPFAEMEYVSDVKDMKPHSFIVVYNTPTYSNIQDIIDNKIERVYFNSKYVPGVTDVIKVIKAGFIRCLRSSCPIYLPYHVDFTFGPIYMSNYYGWIESLKTVSLYVSKITQREINNNLIRLRGKDIDPQSVKSKYIKYSTSDLPQVECVITDEYKIRELEEENIMLHNYI